MLTDIRALADHFLIALPNINRCEPNGIPKALITTWWEQGWPDPPKGSRISRFGADETQIDTASEQHDTKPWNFFYFFFDIFLLVRSTKEVTTENLSLNKWKTWPAEFSKDCEKCEKTSRGENSNFGGEFCGSKIFKPANGGDRQIQKNFRIDFDIWNVEIGVCMRQLWLFYERTTN